MINSKAYSLLFPLDLITLYDIIYMHRKEETMQDWYNGLTEAEYASRMDKALKLHERLIEEYEKEEEDD